MTNESFTTDELAQMLKVSKLTIYDLIKKGELQAYRVGRQMRIDAAELKNYKYRSREKTRPVKQEKTLADNKKTHPVVISGQDSSLDILARHLEKENPEYRPLRSYTGSLDSLIAMYQNKAHIVSTHLFDGETGQYNTPYVRKLLVSMPFIIVRFIQREIGFITGQGNPKHISTWTDLMKKNMRLVNREPGAGARVLLDEKMRLAGVNHEHVKGYDDVQTSHQDVAAAIASGKGDVGIGIRQVTLTANVDFVPMMKENYDLVMLADAAHRPLVDQVLSLLLQNNLKESLTSLGYQTTDMGKVIWQQ